jgi:hypothetical protein
MTRFAGLAASDGATTALLEDVDLEGANTSESRDPE